MHIRNVLSFLGRPAVRRWFGFFGGGRSVEAREDAKVSQNESQQAEADSPSLASTRTVDSMAAELHPEARNSPAEFPLTGHSRPGRAVIALPDPEVEALQVEIAVLKGKIADLSARRLEMEQLVQRFEYSQYQVLGERLVENLRLRHEYLKLKAARSGSPEDLEAEQEAAAELEAYHRVREEGMRQAPASLADKDLDELKRLYRAAAMRCHPDRVAAADKAAAHDFFLRAQTAYRQNDLDGLRLLHRQLTGEGDLSGAASSTGNAEVLRLFLSDLQDRAADLILAIQTMQLDDGYRKARQVNCWDDYFTSVREILDAESHGLKQKIRGFPKA